MNGVELFYNQIPLAPQRKHSSKRAETNITDFGQLLMTKITTAETLNYESAFNEKKEPINGLDMLSSLKQSHFEALFLVEEDIAKMSLESFIDSEFKEKLPEALMIDLKYILNEKNSLEKLFERLETRVAQFEENGEKVEAHKQLKALITHLKEVSHVTSSIEELSKSLYEVGIWREQDIDIHAKMITQQLENVLNEARVLLTRLKTDQNIQQATVQINDLTEKWMTLEQTANQFDVSIQAHMAKSEIDDDTLEIWKELLNTFQKRSPKILKTQQRSSLPVQNRDIAKLLSDAFPKLNSRNIGQVSHHTLSNSQTPLPELEQYVIHMNPSGRTETAGKQLMDQFQHIIKSSRFLSNKGVNQLSISLRPQNMGDMMIRFTQLDGEMTVKIIVSSSMTRQMLESNIQELRHMFSPQQVIIEEQDIESQDVQEELKDESAYEEGEDQQNQGNDEKEEDNDNDFEKRFLELLMNEKV